MLTAHPEGELGVDNKGDQAKIVRRLDIVQKVGVQILAREREKLVEGDQEHFKALFKTIMKA